MSFIAFDNIIPILQVRILRLREVKPLSQGHPARNHHIQDSSHCISRWSENSRVVEDRFLCRQSSWELLGFPGPQCWV